MSGFIEVVREELRSAGSTPQGDHLRTGDIRRISARAFRGLKDKSRDHVFSLCGELLGERSWPMGVIAFDFAYRVKDQYDDTTFPVFEGWLKEYVRGWGDCDDFCTHAFGALICRDTGLSKKTILWAEREEFWMRRASAVVLIPSIWQDKYSKTNPLEVSDALMLDGHDLVLKGYGWMLKILSTKEPGQVYDYLLANKDKMPRVAYRYALEKLDAAKRAELMR